MSQRQSEKDVDKDTESVETKEVKDVTPELKAREGPNIVLDAGQLRVRFRKRWYQFW